MGVEEIQKHIHLSEDRFESFKESLLLKFHLRTSSPLIL
jgi:hypothetical protein